MLKTDISQIWNPAWCAHLCTYGILFQTFWCGCTFCTHARMQLVRQILIIVYGSLSTTIFCKTFRGKVWNFKDCETFSSAHNLFWDLTFVICFVNINLRHVFHLHFFTNELFIYCICEENPIVIYQSYKFWLILYD